MSCTGTSKEQDTCNVEKMGCKGCAYYKTEDELIKMIKELEKERDYYKERYLEFNNAFTGGQDYD